MTKKLDQGDKLCRDQENTDPSDVSLLLARSKLSLQLEEGRVSGVSSNSHPTVELLSSRGERTVVNGDLGRCKPKALAGLEPPSRGERASYASGDPGTTAPFGDSMSLAALVGLDQAEPGLHAAEQGLLMGDHTPDASSILAKKGLRMRACLYEPR
jgi:hypothetical protein